MIFRMNEKVPGTPRYPGLDVALVWVFVCTLAVMTLFEVVKQLVNPGITVWQSHMVTILFTSCLAVIIAFFALKSIHAAHQAASGELEKRVAAEAYIRSSEARYRSFVESASDSIYTVDREGRYLLINRKHLERKGIHEDDYQGKRYANFHSLEETNRFLGLVSNVTVEKVSIQDEYEKEGRYFLRQLNPVIDPDTGEVSAVTVISEEITDRKRTEKRLLQANRQLNLLSHITRHDIQNQVTILIGYTEMLHEKVKDPALEKYFSVLSSAARQVSATIRFTKEYEKVGMREPLWQDCRVLAARAAKTVLPEMFSVENEIPAGAQVYADPLIIKVFNNLLDNAGRHGGTLTKVRFFLEEHEHSHVIVCEDDGIGVPEGEKEQVFERGFGKNTGLGLFLSRDILSITGITIRETGEPGKGARFEIQVPEGMFRHHFPETG